LNGESRFRSSIDRALMPSSSTIATGSGGTGSTSVVEGGGAGAVAVAGGPPGGAGCVSGGGCRLAHPAPAAVRLSKTNTTPALVIITRISRLIFPIAVVVPAAPPGLIGIFATSSTTTE
jgi:hypothetical protein